MFFSAVTVALVATAVVLWLRWRQKHFTTFERLGIPGPKPSIFFGNFLEMRQKGPIQCQKDWMKQYGKVVGFYYGFTPVVLVADLNLLKQIQIKEFHNYVDRPELFSIINSHGKIFDNQLTNLKGQRWKEVRSIMTPAFTSGKMKQMTGVMNKAVDELMENIEKNAKTNLEFNIYGLYQRLTMDVIGQAALGIESGVQKKENHPLLEAVQLIFKGGRFNWMFIIGRSFKEFSSIISLFLIGVFILNGRGNSIQTVMDMSQDVVIQRKKDPSKRRPDLLQGLIDAEGDSKKIDDQTLTLVEEENEQQKNGDIAEKTTERNVLTKHNLTNDEITSNALVMLLAGYETTSTALAFTTHYLLRNLEIQDLLHKEVDKVLQEKQGDISYNSLQELKYMDQVVQESLRIAPPVYQFVNREATDDIELDQWRIPKGMAIMIPVYNIHHDPDNWEEPEKFDPNRFAPGNKSSRDPMVWQAFGAGPRNCIGLRFAMMETKLALAKILRKYRLQPSQKTEKGPPVLEEGTAIASPKNNVYLKVVLRRA